MLSLIQDNQETIKEDGITHVFIDMDGVLADFSNSDYFTKRDKVMRKPPRMFEVGFFENLAVLPGARWAIRVLLKNPRLKLHILTKPVTNSFICYSEKVAWISKHFPELRNSVMIVHDKSFTAGPGRILIDDYAVEWKDGWEAAGGRFIHFQTNRSKYHWDEICQELSPDYFNVEENNG